MMGEDSVESVNIVLTAKEDVEQIDLIHFQLLSAHPDRPVLLSLQLFPLRSVGGQRRERQRLPGQEESRHP